MTTQQPEALRLADTLELAPEDGVEPQTAEDAAAELRRQHTRIAELEAQLSSSGFTAADMATASAQGFRDGVASIAASAGSEPVAPSGWREAIGEIRAGLEDSEPSGYDNSGYRAFAGTVLDAVDDALAQLVTHPSPPEGMVGGWTKASQQLPPCRDDQLYLGINTAGFAGVFNAVADIAGDVHCMYETPEETIDVMSSLDIWQSFTPPTTSAGSGKGE